MTKPAWTIARLPTLIAVSLSLVQCDGDRTLLVCPADLSDTDAGKRVQAFIDTSNALIVAATEIDSDMLNACRSMGHDLGIPAANLRPTITDATSPGAATDAACRRVRNEVDRIIHDDLVANASMAIVSTPSVCTIDAGARLLCEQQCDPVTVTVTRLGCTPGHAYGQCMAICVGTCTGSCSAGCVGKCSGTCAGDCAGDCNGVCAGTCSAKNADGSCYGVCNGSCTGTCNGSCSGSCSASCSGSCGASCVGTCEGECSQWVEPPRCTEIKDVTTVQECRTNCDARAHFEAACTEPSVTISYGYTATTAQKAALDRLTSALQNNYSDFLRIGARATLIVADAVGGYRTALEGITSTAQQVGLGASACIADAITRVASAAAKVQISASVSVSISASVAAQGGVAAQ